MAPSVEVLQHQSAYNEDPLLDLSNSSEGETSDQPITKPGDHDVLLGRGGGTNNHSGNIKFRKLVNDHKMRYLACSKVDKPKVAREVVAHWRKMNPPGRFLARKDETRKGPGSVKSADNVWYEVGDKKAREKASQCLRERTPDVMPYIKHLREQQDAITEQGVSLVQKHLQMQQQGNASNSDSPLMSAPHVVTPQQPQQAPYNSPGNMTRNTLNQGFRPMGDGSLNGSMNGNMMGHSSPPAGFNQMPYNTGAKMAAAGIGHPGVAGATYGMQQQQPMPQPVMAGSMGLGHSQRGAPVSAAELYGD